MAFFPLAHVRFLAGVAPTRRLYRESYPVDARNGSLSICGAPAHKQKGATGRSGEWCLQPRCLRKLAGARALGLPGRTAKSPIYLSFAASLAAQLGSKAEWMEEKRKHPRTDINEPAYVSSGGSVMGCVVRNISVEGAAIDVENPAFVPQRFRLVMANDSSVREYRVTWIQQNRIGLTFLDTP
jgi:PilZ domain